MVTSLQPLGALRLTRIMREFEDVRLLPQELKFLNRTAIVPATDGEITAYYTGRVQIADLVADDAQAVTYNHGKFRFETTTVPNLKLGINLTQEQINQLLMLQSAVGAIDEVGITNFIIENNEKILLGIRQRMEALLVAMATDGLSYDRLGMKLSGVTWGMPSDLKVTVSVGWENASTATPVEDILALLLVASSRYGEVYDRVTMSVAAFRKMIATTEFQNKARTFLAPNVSFTNLSLSNLDQQRQLAQSVIGLEIEFYDARYWSQDQNGNVASYRFLPINKVILSNSSDDNSSAATDWANSIVTESVVAELATTNIIGTFGGPVRGPVSYVTAPPNLNPPNLVQWGVARGFPRKHRRSCQAVMTVGSFSDPIDPNDPF